MKKMSCRYLRIDKVFYYDYLLFQSETLSYHMIHIG